MNIRKDNKMADEQLKLENQLCFRLYTAARLTMGAYHPYLDPLGITYPQYLVMLVLWEQDKQPVCDIAKKLLLDTNTVTPLLQRMEKAGFISRTKGKTDTRQRIVSLTQKGKALYEQAKPIPECLLNDVALKTGEMEDLVKIIPTLDMLIDGLKKTKQLYSINSFTFKDMKEKVLQAMREFGAPVNAGKIAEITGIDRKEVDKAFAELKKEGTIVSPVRCKWEPAQ